MFPALGLKVGKVIDSDDDMTRLRLVDKYVGTEMVRVFNESPAGQVSPATAEGSFSDTQPYGAITVTRPNPDSTLPDIETTVRVDRAEGGSSL